MPLRGRPLSTAGGKRILNLRRVDNTYFLSGGWTNLKEDFFLLQDNRIKGVVDLQFTLEDDPSLASQIGEECNEKSILYTAIPMYDWEVYEEYQLDSIFEHIHTVLQEYEDKLKTTIQITKYPDGRPMLAGASTRKSILIKCGTGTSRSVAALLYHFCSKNKSSYIEELWGLREKEEGKTEFGTSPNYAFASYLNKKFPDEDYQ